MTAFAARAFGAVALALMGAIAAELTTGADTEQPIPDAAPQPLLPAASPPQDHPEQRDQNAARVLAVLARPLFTPGRRPPSPDAMPVPPPISLPHLTGTLVSREGRRALFGTAGNPAVLGEGDRIDAWTVEAISPGKVTLAGPDGPRVLHVSFARDGGVQQAQVVRLLVSLRPVRTHSRMNAAARS